MAFKHFQILKALTGDRNATVAINPDNVIAVFETNIPIQIGGEEGEEQKYEYFPATVLVMPDGKQFNLQESYLDVVARLNEQ